MSLRDMNQTVRQLVDNIETVIVGKREAVKLSVATLLSGGHMLIEDLPGVGKTMLARALARSVGGTFKRVQFTPDLLPSDITGVSIYHMDRCEFDFRPGPIFANVLLADEINRATPKSQAALLEAMEESQVTVDGRTHLLPKPFFVIATENPIEFEGTYTLPEAQLDRFMARVNLGYPSHADEVDVLTRQIKEHPIHHVEPVVTAEEVVELQAAVRDIHVEDSLKHYLVSITEATRVHPDLDLGASPRGSIALMRLAQALAVVDKRDYVTPDDIKQVAVPALAHRIAVRADRRIQGISAAQIIHDILDSVAVPVGEVKN